MLSLGSAPQVDTLTPRRLVDVRDDLAEVEEGSPTHAVPMDGKQRGPALCGTRPGKFTAWNIHAGITVSCCKCQDVLNRGRP